MKQPTTAQIYRLGQAREVRPAIASLLGNLWAVAHGAASLPDGSFGVGAAAVPLYSEEGAPPGSGLVCGAVWSRSYARS
jgi:hypothetical protein